MSRFINSIYIKNYRGFKDEQELSLSENGHITFLIGCNNTGKSLITRLLSLLPRSLEKSKKANNNYKLSEVDDTDFYMFDTNQEIKVCFDVNKEYIEENKNIFENKDEYITWIKKFKLVLLNINIIKVNNTFEMELFVSENKNKIKADSIDELKINYQMEEIDIKVISKVLYTEIIKNILVFDSIRSFDRVGYSNRLSGSEIIEWLKTSGDQGNKQRCKQKVLEWIKNEFNLEAPLSVESSINKNELSFVFDGQLKLDSSEVGTGYTMLYILLMEICRNNKRLIIIDEIESHLQPGIIRVLMNIIQEQDSIQFIVSTHSSTVIGAAKVNDYIYKFYKIGSECKLEGFFRTYENGSKSAKILRDVYNSLGIMPGNVLLSNCVVWVEGPSEVFWIRAWIREYLKYLKKNNKKLRIVEGLHYSILMTGGSNISHLSFEEEEMEISSIEEDYLLKVLKVNPNPFVIIDSDNMKKGNEKYNRMIRIAKELNSQNKLNDKLKDKVLSVEDIEDKIYKIPNFWIMEGKELENYCHPDLLKRFYTNRAEQKASKIKGVDTCTDWNVFSKKEGVGEILASRGITNVDKASGTIKHKDELARYVYNNLTIEHFEKEIDGMEKPDEDMLKNLINSLQKLIDYIVTINDL